MIDLFGFSEKEVRQNFPTIYQHVLTTVRPKRAGNRKQYRVDQWWLFGENNPLLRRAISGLKRYIGTVETAKHRVFQFVDGAIVPDHMVIAIALEDAYSLGVLQSASHLEWTYAACALLGVARFEQGHRYSKSVIFDPFPFPDATPAQRKTIGDLAEELDLTRRVALDENPGLTMTGLYNMVAALRAGEAMTPAAEAAAVKARARIVQKLHADLDAAVAAAYGWPATLAPADIVAALAALNATRAAEEAAGTIRWLRPDYQAGR